ncbi:MAG: GDP-mannose 4,6-dehydratase [Candidatus Aminicenantes bacterium RBG_13_62_12]|jgi:GDP-4-dehydro-6-deoxy-D-mannose reductase|nr:MAG: GDP-mannose 4,6-dehydratase [Candidatus Aminicenantes bacterium RBG_13_62_12]
MRVLITGITGFAGSHLAEFLIANHPDVKVFGIVRWRSRMENILPIRDNIELCEADLKDMVSLQGCLAHIRPDRIFHLAAQSFVPTSWKCPAETFAINATGQINLFESLLSLKQSPLIQVAGSSEEYGRVFPDEIPMKETNPLRPLSPYAVSKVAQDLLGYQYFQSYGLSVVRTRGFNHTGPRRGEVFVTSSLAKQIAAIEKGVNEPVIKVGNLDAKRDFSDVRDIVEAYWLSLEKGEPGDVYNIGSGVSRPIREVLDTLLSLSKVNVRVEVDPQRLRPSDVPILLADSSKFVAQTGWKPRFSFRQTLSDLLDYWRRQT